MALGFTNVYILKPGETYASVQKFCPNDGYELTRVDANDSRKIWYIENCPIDPVMAATVTVVGQQVLPLFTALATIPDHAVRVDMIFNMLQVAISGWLLSDPAWLPKYADFIIDHGFLRQMIYAEAVRQNIITELASMNPPEVTIPPGP